MMKTITRFAVKTLEFDKVKELAAAKAATALGREMLLNMTVAADFETVKRLQEETAEALRLLDDGKRFPFGGVHNLTAPVKRAKLGGTLEIEELMQVQTTLAGFSDMKIFLLKDSEMAPNLAEYGRALQEFPKIVRQLEKAISEKGEILDSASVKLGGLRTGVMTAKSRVRDKLESILHDPNNQKYFQDNLVTMRGDRYVIPIKQEYKLNFPGVVHDQSGTGATLFIEPLAVVNLNNDIKRYLAEEKEEIERILKQLSENIGVEADKILESLQLMTRIDTICSKAYLAVDQQAVRPQMISQGGLSINHGRHPLIAKDKVVPLDISLGDKFNTLLVTGPNTGGKTVALKAVGIFAMMAQTGMFVPALNAKLPVFRAVFADIGDEQSIEQSLSTFSGHMMNLIGILHEVRAGDLVLIDEICAGTDPNEGAALAMSIIQYLHDMEVLSILTTHYSELKTFAFGREGMENASVEFNPETLLPTYRLLMGVPGSSNAFNISKKLGLPEDIISKAGEYLNSEHVHMEDVLQGLEGERRKYESSNREIDNLRYESEKLKNQLEYQKRELEKRKNEIMRKAREDADELYRNSRRETESILKELRAMKKNLTSEALEKEAEKARQTLDKQFSIEAPLPEGTPLTPKTAKIGQSVFVTSLRKKGSLVEVNGNSALVAVGILKMNVPLSSCLSVQTAVAEPQNRSRYRKGFAHKMFVAKLEASPTEIDLRGMTTDEAIPYVDKAIDDAILAGMTKVRLLHGKGTGALRAGLLAYLKKHKAVKACLMADLSDGGAGVTIVELK